jgi:ABC-type dipeptide/oligopeptide/nickel transport system ATPase component
MNFHPDAPLLEVRNLRVSFPGNAGTVGAVQNVSFSLASGRTLALVGESGSGKTVTAHALLRLVPRPGVIEAGRIIFRSRRVGEIDLSHLDEKSGLLFNVRGGLMSLIFQEPMTALNPLVTIGDQIAEVFNGEMDASQTVTNLDCLNLGKMGACWKVSVDMQAIQTGDQKAGHNNTTRNRYRIIWQQVVAAAPSFT